MVSKILIVEDEPDIARMLASFLSHLGHECEVAVNGYEALGKIPGGEYSLVVLDIGLPGMTGLEVAEKIRESNGRLPILGVTGYDDPLMKSQARHAGFNYVLFKPVDPDEMEKCVEHLLNGKFEGKWAKSREWKV